MKSGKILLLMLGVAFVSVVATVTVMNNMSPAAAKAQNLHNRSHSGRHDMDFKVADGLQELEFTSEIRCKKHFKGKGEKGKRGCFKVKKRQRGEISFRFAGLSGWTLKQFQICTGESKNRVCSPAGLPGREFLIAADKKATLIYGPDANGSIDLSKLPANTDGSVDFYLFDENSVEQEYFYSISACPTTPIPPLPGTCIWTDPPIVNRGRRR